jgi:hypothetical protein
MASFDFTAAFAAIGETANKDPRKAFKQLLTLEGLVYRANLALPDINLICDEIANIYDVVQNVFYQEKNYVMMFESFNAASSVLARNPERQNNLVNSVIELQNKFFSEGMHSETLKCASFIYYKSEGEDKINQQFDTILSFQNTLFGNEEDNTALNYYSDWCISNVGQNSSKHEKVLESVRTEMGKCFGKNKISQALNCASWLCCEQMDSTKSKMLKRDNPEVIYQLVLGQESIFSEENNHEAMLELKKWRLNNIKKDTQEFVDLSNDIERIKQLLPPDPTPEERLQEFLDNLAGKNGNSANAPVLRNGD